MPALPIAPQIDEPMPGDVLARLPRIPYFAEAYAEDGLTPAQFVTHPALQATAGAFVRSMEAVEAFAAQHTRMSM